MKRCGECTQLEDGTCAKYRKPPPSDEFLAKLARGQRDVLLTASDWTQQPDVQHPADVAAAWRTYRQALRDITSQPGFPQNVIWPVAPGGAA